MDAFISAVKNIFDPSSDLNFNGYTAKDIKINSFEIKDGYGYIDMNEAYLSWLNFGTTAEWNGIACLVNSFLETYGLEKIWLTINGGMLSTAHAGDFDYPIGYWGQYI